MNSQQNIFIQNQQPAEELDLQQSVKIPATSDRIQIFLNQTAFIDQHPDINQNQTQIEPAEVKNYSHLCLKQEINFIASKRKKSIFHNFQKHLITLIKKFMIISKNKMETVINGHIAMEIWEGFQKTRSFNKKILNIVFGAPTQIQFLSLLKQYCQFKKLEKYPIQDLLQAQIIIREEVTGQAKTMQKGLIKSSSNINPDRFQQFYQYYKCFIDELQQGPIAKRMTKRMKSVVLNKLGKSIDLN